MPARRLAARHADFAGERRRRASPQDGRKTSCRARSPGIIPTSRRSNRISISFARRRAGTTRKSASMPKLASGALSTRQRHARNYFDRRRTLTCVGLPDAAWPSLELAPARAGAANECCAADSRERSPRCGSACRQPAARLRGRRWRGRRRRRRRSGSGRRRSGCKSVLGSAGPTTNGSGAIRSVSRPPITAAAFRRTLRPRGAPT